MASLVRTAGVVKMMNPQGAHIASCMVVQSRTVYGRALRESLPCPPPKPAPFDYVNKDYTLLRSLIDRTTHRFDQNTKVIVVEGPPACGKTDFAKTIADDLNMKHFPEANMDYHYIRPNGQDLRKFDKLIPEDTRTFDHTNFNLTPTHRLAGNFQIMQYTARFAQYIDALAHLMNTGQGVVLERSPFSDFVFLEAMVAQKYISKGVRNVYYQLRNNTIEELMRPHLVIYLDVPAKCLPELIKSRGLPHEVKGKALTPEFLTEVERQYKNKYLRDISTHAELLVYDWTAGGDPEVVVEDIERIDFDKHVHRDDPKLKDWRMAKEMDWADKRMLYTNGKAWLLNLFCVPILDVPELITSADDAFAREQVIDADPSFAYEVGYTNEFGGLLFKSKMPKYTEHI